MVHVLGLAWTNVQLIHRTCESPELVKFIYSDARCIGKCLSSLNENHIKQLIIIMSSALLVVGYRYELDVAVKSEVSILK